MNTNAIALHAIEGLVRRSLAKKIKGRYVEPFRMQICMPVPARDRPSKPVTFLGSRLVHNKQYISKQQPSKKRLTQTFARRSFIVSCQAKFCVK